MVEEVWTRGAILGRKYTLGETLGEGPAGPVFAAEERFRNQRVAIKMARLPSSIRVRQFLRDVALVQSVRSENVVFVHDAGAEGDAPYIVMERLDGCNLADLLAKRGPLPVDEAVAYVLQACQGLHELHAARAVHRHVKPSNLFLAQSSSGEPRIVLLDAGFSSIAWAIDAGDDARGLLLDALKYAAPEILDASSTPRAAKTGADPRTDIWSLAATLHVLVTGSHPFAAADAAAIRAAIHRGVPEIPVESRLRQSRRPPGNDIPAALAEVLTRALSPIPDARFPAISDFADALRALPAPAPASLSHIVSADAPSRHTVQDSRQPPPRLLLSSGEGWGGGEDPRPSDTPPSSRTAPNARPLARRPPMLWFALGGTALVLLLGLAALFAARALH